MNQDRISACSVSSLVGPEHQQAAPVNLQAQFNTEMPRAQSRSGNKIGHNPHNLRFYTKPSGQKRRFHAIEEAQRRVKDAIENPFDYPIFHGLMFHENGRSIRSERLEAELAILLPMIFDTVNLAQMQLGQYLPNGDFKNFTYDTLVSRTGMSYWRVERNMYHLKKAGIVDVKSIVYETNDGYKTERVIIAVSEKIFSMLHLDSLFLEDREKAMRNRQKIINKVEARDKYLSLYRPRPFGQKKKVDSFNGSISSIADSKRPTYHVYNPASDRQVIALAGELIKAHLCANMRDAITLACTKLGKTPPS